MLKSSLLKNFKSLKLYLYWNWNKHFKNFKQKEVFLHQCFRTFLNILILIFCKNSGSDPDLSYEFGSGTLNRFLKDPIPICSLLEQCCYRRKFCCIRGRNEIGNFDDPWQQKKIICEKSLAAVPHSCLWKKSRWT